MKSQTIDTVVAKRMIEAAAIRGASIIGQPGGWSIMLELGSMQRPLGTQRSDKPRVWRSLDRCVEYLKTELNIARVDLLDATDHSSDFTGNVTRADTAERMGRGP